MGITGLGIGVRESYEGRRGEWLQKDAKSHKNYVGRFEQELTEVTEKTRGYEKCLAERWGQNDTKT